MKKTILIFATLSLLISSCIKKIDLNLKEDQKRTVINTRLLNGTNDFKVKLSKSGNYFGGNSITSITNASITLFDGTSSHTLTNSGDGNYILPSFTANSNQEYKLTVTENGNIHEATATLPNVVSLDSISYYFQPSNGFNDSGYVISAEMNDPINEANYYKIEFTVNGEIISGQRGDFITLDDSFVNGNHLVFPVTGELQKFDTIVMNLFSIDKTTYDYYNQLGSAISGDGAAPSNPSNNFGKDVLGNFSVMAISSKTVVLN